MGPYTDPRTFGITIPEKQKPRRGGRAKFKICNEFGGSPTWARTRDLRINSPSLYRLSYRGIVLEKPIVTAATRGVFYLRMHARSTQGLQGNEVV